MNSARHSCACVKCYRPHSESLYYPSHSGNFHYRSNFLLQNEVGTIGTTAGAIGKERVWGRKLPRQPLRRKCCAPMRCGTLASAALHPLLLRFLPVHSPTAMPHRTAWILKKPTSNRLLKTRP